MNSQQLIAYPQGTTEPLTYPTGEVILDLFKDEPIPLTLNVDDFTNVAEADASYSKSFDIPGTKNNNLFFNHIYDITADSNFNPHIKTKIIVKEGSFNTFEGYLQLNDIVIKDGAITYNITLYSEAVNLKDILSDRVFRDLDLSELSHSRSDSNIKDSWTGNLGLLNTLPANSFAGSGTTTDVLKYPLIRWNNKSYYNSSIAIPIKADVISDFFRPFLNVKYLIQNIFRDAGYTISSAFFNTAAFNKLFVDFNYLGIGYNEILSMPIVVSDTPAATTYSGNTWTNLDFTNVTVNGSGAPSNYNTATDIFTLPVGAAVTVNASLDIVVSVASTISVRMVHNGSSWWTSPWPIFVTTTLAPGTHNVSWSSSFFPITLGNNGTIEMEIKSDNSVSLGSSSNVKYTNALISSISANDILAEYRGDINQWDFLKGMIDMFKLVVISDSNDKNNLIIEPYKDWVDAGNVINLTNKVDDDDIKYTSIDGLSKEILFKLAEDEPDWITINHNKPNDWKYPHKEVNNIEIFDNDSDSVEVKEFSATYVKSQFGSELFAPQIIDEANNESWENRLRMLYDNGVQTMSNDSYDFNNDNWTTTNDYLLFSMVDSYPISANNSNSYNFGVVNYYGPGGAVLNSLYNVYWMQYIDELYHKDTRIVKLVAYLTANDINELNFNDIILIKNKKFRLHKIEYRAGAMSKLELITIKDL
tara:strand:- start:8082 stop:10184 length:2103 start_codon:yes stop_codon:yes gene_type:complete